MGMMEMISLPQKTLRWILIPANATILIVILICTIVPYVMIPDTDYTPFVFWLFKPTLLVEIVLSATVLVMGFTGATKYNKCWQGSYSFFILLLVITAICAILTANNIMDSANTVIPDLQNAGQYLSYLFSISVAYGCPVSSCNDKSLKEDVKPYICWDDDNLSISCKAKITAEVSDIPGNVKPWLICALVFLIIYFVFNVFFFLFVADSDDSNREMQDAE